MVVAVGGGSVIDLAKVTALLLAHGAPLADYYAVQSVPGPIVPLVALPTTAGTGSEATPVAVITDPSTKMKIGVASRYLIPRHAICDPLLTIGAPPTVTAHAGIDALAHAIESFIAAREEPSPELVLGRPQVGKNLLSDALAVTAAGYISAASSAPLRTGPTSRPGPACSTARCWPGSRSATPASAPRTRSSSPSARPRTRRTVWGPACCCPMSWSTTGRRVRTRSRSSRL